MAIEQAFLEYIENLPGGSVFAREELLCRFEGYEKQISRLLSTLKDRGEVLPIGRGLWQCPRQSRFGVIFASPEAVVAALERTRGLFTVPAGAKVLNEIGASTQLPMKRRYVATKRVRSITLGKVTIEFEYRHAFATMVGKLEKLSSAEKRSVARLWVALDCAGRKHALNQKLAFRRAFGELSNHAQQQLSAVLTGKLEWARELLN